MPLIKCPECQSEISDQALNCPKCGRPMKQNAEQKIQTVQLTTKKWKLTKLLSIIVFIIGLIVLVSGRGGAQSGIGGFLMLLGFVGWIIGKFGAWWTNK